MNIRQIGPAKYPPEVQHHHIQSADIWEEPIGHSALPQLGCSVVLDWNGQPGPSPENKYLHQSVYNFTEQQHNERHDRMTCWPLPEVNREGKDTMVQQWPLLLYIDVTPTSDN